MKKRINAIILVTLLFITLITINCYARHYKVNSSNTETDNDFWNGWKVFHYGATDIGSKKGDTITYKRKVINSNGTESEYETSVTTRGYGYYSFDFSKHILGLLTYLKNKITDYPTEYVPVKIIPDFDPFGNPKEPEAVKMRAAIDETINKLISNWYSNDYEIGEFADFWTKCITNKVNEYGNELKKLQNKFYFEAYASSAIKKLSKMMGSKYDELSPKQKTALRGVVFSIMEARYRDKNLQGKRNLKLKVAEGDLWPFLVNITNLNEITRDKNTGRYEPAPEFPELDDIIDGAYQWMYYYDSQINHSTSHSTVTSYLNEQLENEEELEADWEGEYDELTDDDFPYLNSNRELEEFYTRCSIVRTLFKKSTENTEGIFGAEEIYDITSEVSFSEAMANMKRSMLSFADKAGKEIKDVFNGLTDYNIERTYLMAKNIVENENIQNEYAYYNIGTNVLTYTPGIDGDEYLLIDFQKVKLKESLVIFNGNKREISEVDTDEDGILDRNELGERENSPMFKKVNITGFIKKMVEDELYGDDTEYKKTLTSSADIAHYVHTKHKQINTAIANIKYNIYTKRKEFLDTHDDIDNIKDRVELYEHYLNLDETTTNEISSMRDKNDIINKLASNDAKLEVALYKYRSNPIFKDTDFDGIDDKTETDNSFKPKNGLRKKDNVNAQVGESINIEDTMDYRYFFMSNKNYYDELARMSLIMSNAVSNGNGGVDDKNETKNMSYINTAMQSIGMNCDYADVSKDNFIAGLAIGHNEVEYYDIKKNIILVAVSNARNVGEYCSFADIGKSDWTTTLNSNHSKAHEILANEVYNRINTYLTTHNINENVVYWVTGYGTGGGIANLLSEKLINNPLVSTKILNINTIFDANNYKWEETGMTNVYCYTFGAPNVVYTEEKDMGINNNKYKSIFNIVDTSDISAHLPSTATGWHKYGWNMSVTDNAENCSALVKCYNTMMNGRTRDDMYENQEYTIYKKDDMSIIDLMTYIQSARGEYDLNHIATKFDGLFGLKDKDATYRFFVNKYYAMYDKLEKRHRIKNYYDLCKRLLPEHMKVGDGWNERKQNEIILGIDYDRFPCYQALGSSPININNAVPIMFQSKECWSDLRYGTRYKEIVGKHISGKEILYDGKLYNDSGYQYGNFKESSCACCSLAMVISYERDETITPVDVRNMFEENNIPYRTDTSQGTDHKALNEACEIFGLNNLAESDSETNTNINYDPADGSFTISNSNGYILIDYLIAGHPLITRCNANNSTFKTDGTHFFVIAGVDEDDVKKYRKKDGTIDREDYNNIRIYISNPAAGKGNCKEEYNISDFNDSNTTKYWVFDGSNKTDYTLNIGKFDYYDSAYSEWFKYQKDDTFKEHTMKNRTWENPKK